MMMQDNEPRNADDLDVLVRAVLNQPPPREEQRARGAVSLATLAADENRRTAGVNLERPTWPGWSGWRVRVATGITAVAVAGTLAFAIADAGPTRSMPGPSHATLTAFTVTRHDDTVKVTLRELDKGWSAADRAALQRRLRADGIPAVVGFRSIILVEQGHPPVQQPNTLKCYPAPLWNRVFTTVRQRNGRGPRFPGGDVYDIHLARIPKGARIIIPVNGADSVNGYVLIGGLLIMPSGLCLI